MDSTLTVSIDQNDGEPLSRLVGNPMTLRVRASLDIGDKMISEWLLGSWCGTRSDVMVTADFEGLGASQSLKKLPYGDTCPTISLYSLNKSHEPQD